MRNDDLHASSWAAVDTQSACRSTPRVVVRSGREREATRPSIRPIIAPPMQSFDPPSTPPQPAQPSPARPGPVHSVLLGTPNPWRPDSIPFSSQVPAIATARVRTAAASSHIVSHDASPRSTTSHRSRLTHHHSPPVSYVRRQDRLVLGPC
eukprot:COSAG02_NODE_462_length_21838_cov_17.900501_5_plen_151_part_00